MLNFGAIAIGSYFTDSGASSDWYQNLNKAPWTPLGIRCSMDFNHDLLFRTWLLSSK